MYPKVLIRDNDPNYSVVVKNEAQERELPPEYNSTLPQLPKPAEQDAAEDEPKRRGRKPAEQDI